MFKPSYKYGKTFEILAFRLLQVAYSLWYKCTGISQPALKMIMIKASETSVNLYKCYNLESDDNVKYFVFLNFGRIL